MYRKGVLRSVSLALAIAAAGLPLSATGAARAADSSTASKSSADKATTANHSPQPTPSLDSVEWTGPGISLDNLRGKTVVILPFVTWCPKCNVWAPEMLDQISTAIKDKPVVVIAVATDVDAAQGKAFIVKKGLTGLNVFYGANPKMNEQLGLEAANLWNYAWINPQGAVKTKGAAGASLPNGDKKEFIVPRQINTASDLGKFEFMTPEMSPAVKEIVWSIELGDVATLVKVSQKRNLRGLAKDDQDELAAMSTKFLDGQVSAAKELASGDIPKRIQAYDKASRVSAAFASTSQGKEAKKIATELTSDSSFRRELTARKLYDQGVAKAAGDDAKLAKNMHVVAQRFPDTYFGGLAKQAIESEK